MVFIRLNQTELFSEENVRLRLAVVSDGDTTNFEILTTLPSSCHMHEYAQDAIVDARHYGCPDLFIAFTSDPAWGNILQLLLPWQSFLDRHEITARVFRQMLKSLMDLMVKYEVVGSVRCGIYSVECYTYTYYFGSIIKSFQAKSTM